MTREELADQLFQLLKADLYEVKDDVQIWKTIAETDDKTCLNELERRLRL